MATASLKQRAARNLLHRGSQRLPLARDDRTVPPVVLDLVVVGRRYIERRSTDNVTSSTLPALHLRAGK
jgi:hypothetical protein